MPAGQPSSQPGWGVCVENQVLPFKPQPSGRAILARR